MTASPLPTRARLGRAGAALGVALLGSTACGLPTEIPQVDQRWSVPAQTTTIDVASLLPASVHVLPDRSAFTVDLAAVSVTRALSADCAACAAANGTTVPKPAFVVTASAATPLPTGVVSASLVSGTLQLTLVNGYNFDPLRPSATARGHAVVTVSNGGVVVGRDSVDGATTAFPAGGTLVRGIALSPGVLTGSSPITISVTLDSPAGDVVQMDASRAITATAAPSGIRISSASVNVVNQQVSSSATIDLANVDATIASHVTGGTLLLDIANPFNVGGTVGVRFSAPNATPIDRTVVIAPGLTHPSVTLSQDELQSLIGRTVTVTVAGPVSQSGGAITVTPTPVVEITSRLDFTLHTGG